MSVQEQLDLLIDESGLDTGTITLTLTRYYEAALRNVGIFDHITGTRMYRNFILKATDKIHWIPELRR